MQSSEPTPPPIPPEFQTSTEPSSPPPEPERRTRWKAISGSLLVVGGLIVGGAVLGGETSTAPWEVGSCVSAANSDDVAAEGDAMVAVECNEPNEGQITGVAASPEACNGTTDFIVGRDGIDHIYCVTGRSTTTG